MVRLFNKEVIEQGNLACFEQQIDPSFIDHSEPAGANTGPGGMLYIIN